MKKTILTLMTLFSLPFYSQSLGNVGINTTTPTATLDINGTARIRTLPQDAMPTKMVTVDDDGNLKQTIIREGDSGFSNAILGYDPIPFSQAQSPVTVNGSIASSTGNCFNRPATGHFYCSYNLSRATNWFDAYNIARLIGGYLVTITSNAERTFIYNSFGLDANLTHNIWLGFNKIARPGNPSILQWITGEDYRINWATNPATTENWFDLDHGQPDNSQGAEGASHIISLIGDAQRHWNDRNPNDTIGYGANFDQLIIEFNE